MMVLFILQLNADYMMHSWGGGIGMGLMFLLWLLILSLIVTVMWFLIRKGSGSSERTNGDPSLEILRNRYARGEIGEEEYQRIKKDLIE